MSSMPKGARKLEEGSIGLRIKVQVEGDYALGTGTSGSPAMTLLQTPVPQPSVVISLDYSSRRGDK